MITILDKQGRVVNQVNSILEVVNIQVPRTHLTRSASDHLPLIVDLKLI
ncbi:MAG: endonuclease/exonuclease/phosphatase family metal-dependent hydrolase [Congregibacter sp.]|jgi:endonuclease/exonuclease/phosphatase family metal-dependent hydrolase